MFTVMMCSPQRLKSNPYDHLRQSLTVVKLSFCIVAILWLSTCGIFTPLQLTNIEDDNPRFLVGSDKQMSIWNTNKVTYTKPLFTKLLFYTITLYTFDPNPVTQNFNQFTAAVIELTFIPEQAQACTKTRAQARVL